jgi:dUTP pyrophosphatase
MNDNKINIFPMGSHKSCKLPKRQTVGAAGFDLYAAVGGKLAPFQRMTVPCGFGIEIPKSTVALIKPRSGLAHKHGIDTLAGVIDSDYRGEVHTIIINLGENDFEWKAGDRIAQLVICEIHTDVEYHLTHTTTTERGAGGFGHTGTHDRQIDIEDQIGRYTHAEDLEDDELEAEDMSGSITPDFDEDRADAIGRNGNDGLHY